VFYSTVLSHAHSLLRGLVIKRSTVKIISSTAPAVKVGLMHLELKKYPNYYPIERYLPNLNNLQTF
jgi:hypothetical protein